MILCFTSKCEQPPTQRRCEAVNRAIVNVGVQALMGYSIALRSVPLA